MIFVTLGSQKFQFNRLLQKIDELIESNVVNEKVYAQIGASDYEPRFFEYERFMSREAFADKMGESDIVITHGGTGAIIGAVKKGKKVIAVPRLEKYGEHVDNHQVQLLRQFDGMNIICACYELEELEYKLQEVKNTDYVRYVSNTETIINDIDAYLCDVFKGKVNG